HSGVLSLFDAVCHQPQDADITGALRRLERCPAEPRPTSTLFRVAGGLNTDKKPQQRWGETNLGGNLQVATVIRG
ncbi:MAG: hypothetical protein ACK46L_15150, partial [Synechococcaceae cyanobacterium]